MRVCLCVCVCVCGRTRACVCVCVRACMLQLLSNANNNLEQVRADLISKQEELDKTAQALADLKVSVCGCRAVHKRMNKIPLQFTTRQFTTGRARTSHSSPLDSSPPDKQEPHTVQHWTSRNPTQFTTGQFTTRQTENPIQFTT